MKMISKALLAIVALAAFDAAPAAATTNLLGETLNANIAITGEDDALFRSGTSETKNWIVARGTSARRASSLMRRRSGGVDFLRVTISALTTNCQLTLSSC